MADRHVLGAGCCGPMPPNAPMCFKCCGFRLAAPLWPGEAKGESMIQLTSSDFQTLCADGTVRERIGALEGERQAAVRQFWLRGLGGLAVGIAVATALFYAGWEGTAFILFAIFLVGAIVAAVGPLMAAKEGLKLPVLAEVARRAGLEYFPNGLTP